MTEEVKVQLQPLLLSKAPYKTWLGERPPEEMPRLDTEGVVDELVQMFPTIEREVVETVAEVSGNSLERALEALLAISDDDPASVAATIDGLTAEERQIKEDELLALQLYRQFAAEEGTRGEGSSADRMYAAIQTEGTTAHAQFQQQPEGVRDAFLKQLVKMRARQGVAQIKGARSHEKGLGAAGPTMTWIPPRAALQATRRSSRASWMVGEALRRASGGCKGDAPRRCLRTCAPRRRAACDARGGQRAGLGAGHRKPKHAHGLVDKPAAHIVRAAQSNMVSMGHSRADVPAEQGRVLGASGRLATTFTASRHPVRPGRARARRLSGPCPARSTDTVRPPPRP